MKTITVLVLVLSLAMAYAEAEEDAAEVETAAESVAESAQTPLTVDQILKRDPERDDYVDENMCISMHRIKRIEVIDEQHVAIEYGRGEHYLIQFTHPCRDLRPNRPVYLERNQSRLCTHDRLWGVRDMGFRLERGMSCHIPGFQSVTKEQIVLLKDQLKAERRQRREARKRS